MPRTPVYGPGYEYYSPEEEEEEEEIPVFEEVAASENVAPEEEEPEPSDILAHQPDQVEELKAEYERLQVEKEKKKQTKELKRNIRRLKYSGISDAGKKLTSVGSGFLSGVKQYVQRSADQREGKREVQNYKLQKIKEKTQQIVSGMGNLGTAMIKSDSKQNMDLLGNSGSSGLNLLGGSGGLNLLGDSGSGLSLFDTDKSSKKKEGIKFTGGSKLSLLGGGDHGSGKTALQAKAALSLFDSSNRTGLLSFNLQNTKTTKRKHRKRKR